MKVTQIYDFLNSLVDEVLGKTDLAVKNLTDMISMGNEVLSSDKTTDKFVNVLVDRIGKTIISNKPYSASVKKFMVDSFTFGAILQKIYVEPMTSSKSDTWDLQNNNSVDQYVISKPIVKQKLFSGITTWDVKVTIPDVQLRSAFNNETSMATFIDAIFTAMLNSIELRIESMVNMTICNFMANKIAHYKTSVGGSLGVVNLLSDYNTLKGITPPLKAEVALRDSDFLKYASDTINKYIKRMERMSTLFNDEEYQRFTTADRLRVILHLDFESAFTTFLESDTFHNELVKLPLHDTVPYWQGSGKDYSFAESSYIGLTTSDGKYTVEQAGIVGLIADVESIGVTIYDRRTKSAYNAGGEYTNYFNKADIGYYNDMSENGVVFIIADTVSEVVTNNTP